MQAVYGTSKSLGVIESRDGHYLSIVLWLSNGATFKARKMELPDHDLVSDSSFVLYEGSQTTRTAWDLQHCDMGVVFKRTKNSLVICTRKRKCFVASSKEVGFFEDEKLLYPGARVIFLPSRDGKTVTKVHKAATPRFGRIIDRSKSHLIINSKDRQFVGVVSNLGIRSRELDHITHVRFYEVDGQNIFLIKSI